MAIILDNLDKNIKLFYQSARKLHLPVALFEYNSAICITLGKKRYFFRLTFTPFNNNSSISVALNKYCVDGLLRSIGVPLQKTLTINKISTTPEQLVERNELQLPVIVRPTLSVSNNSLRVTNFTQLNNYAEQLFKQHDWVTIEEDKQASSIYKVLVFNHEIVSIIQQLSARIIGDGVHTISELVLMANTQRKKFETFYTLGPIILDAECKKILAKQNLNTESIPKNRQAVLLSYDCDALRGGITKSATTNLCQENKDLLSLAAKTLGLELVSFDIQCDDLTIPLVKSQGTVINVNYNPDLTIHENPMLGQGNHVTMVLLRDIIARHRWSYSVLLFKFYINNIKKIFNKNNRSNKILNPKVTTK